MSQLFTVSIKSLADLPFAIRNLGSSLVVPGISDIDEMEAWFEENDGSDIADDYDLSCEPGHWGPFCFDDAYCDYLDTKRKLERIKKRELLDRFSGFFTFPGLSALRPSHRLLPF